MEKIKITRAQETVSIRNEDEDFRQEITETQPALRSLHSGKNPSE